MQVEDVGDTLCLHNARRCLLLRASASFIRRSLSPLHSLFLRFQRLPIGLSYGRWRYLGCGADRRCLFRSLFGLFPCVSAVHFQTIPFRGPEERISMLRLDRCRLAGLLEAAFPAGSIRHFGSRGGHGSRYRRGLRRERENGIRRSTPANVLTEEQRDFYFEHGYLVLHEHLSQFWLDRLTKATDEFIEKSKGYTAKDALPFGAASHDDLADKFSFAEGHTREHPMLTRLASPSTSHETYWEVTSGPFADIASELLGPNVRFHHSKLNFKWPMAMEKVHWHQDIQFWPHTNYTPLTIGVYLNDVDESMGPMDVVPLSEYDQLHALTDENTGAFTGVISRRELKRIPLDKAVRLYGKAGTVTVHNSRCVHSSLPNMSNKARPLLLNTFSCASAGMILAGTNGIHMRSKLGTPLVRGGEPVFTVFDPRPCPMAPDFSTVGYVNPFIKSDVKYSNEDKRSQTQRKARRPKTKEKRKRTQMEVEDLSYILYGSSPPRE